MTNEPSKRLTKRADAAQRAQRGWALRLAGASWQEIATVLGYTDQANALRAVKAYFGQIPTPDHDELKKVWRQRHEVLWRQAQAGIKDGVAGSLRAAVAVARSASQLDGLDEPTRLDLRTPSAAEFDKVLKMLVVAGGHAVEEIDPMVFEEPVDAEVIE